MFIQTLPLSKNEKKKLKQKTRNPGPDRPLQGTTEKKACPLFTKIGPFTEKTKDLSIICNLSINREVYFIVLLYLLIHKHLVTFISILII